MDLIKSTIRQISTHINIFRLNRHICEQEDSVQREIYTPISDQRCCKWSAIQSAVRRAAEKAWALNPEGVQHLAGYPLTGAPSAVQFLEMLYNAVVRGVTKRLPCERDAWQPIFFLLIFA